MNTEPRSAQQINPAAEYEAYSVAAMFRPWSAEIFARANLQPGERVLDLAAGTGILARQAAPMVAPDGSVTALDLSPAMIAVGQQAAADEGVDVIWQEGSAVDLPFEDGSFDVAICQQGFQFFPDRALAARELHRVLKPGGRIAIALWSSLDRNAFAAAMLDVIGAHTDDPGLSAPFAFGDPRAIGALFEIAGFSNVAVEIVTRPTRYPDREHYMERRVYAQTAAMPALASLTTNERADLLSRIQADARPMIDAHADGDDLVFMMSSNLVTAHA